jgi:quercetin dioxygenase-like cupin family protein
MALRLSWSFKKAGRLATEDHRGTENLRDVRIKIKLLTTTHYKQKSMGTTESVKIFIENKDIPWEQVDKGMRRKIMSYDERLMVVKVEFEKGGVGVLHQHPHSQITHVESGVFEVEIGEEKKILSGGDAFYIPPNVIHGAVCLEAGVLIDVFSPMREDFIK